jgi:hypothetical protein
MAEIRKYNPEAGNAIAQALRAAMGEPVRPNVPGEAAARTSTQDAPTPAVVSLSITTAVVGAPNEPAEQDAASESE